MAAARAYLRAFSHGAQVTLVTFDRRPATPFGSGLPVGEALARMQGFAPTSRNGSNVDAAITRADAILAASSAGTRRMLVLTDLLTRQALTPVRLATLALRSGCTVHVATVAQGDVSSMNRDDDDPWSAFPRKTGGLLWHAEAPERDTADRRVFDEWARPKRLDHLKVAGFPEGFSLPEVLEEGAGLEHLALAETAPERISRRRERTGAGRRSSLARRSSAS
jgi:hypothetical protein